MWQGVGTCGRGGGMSQQIRAYGRGNDGDMSQALGTYGRVWGHMVGVVACGRVWAHVAGHGGI